MAQVVIVGAGPTGTTLALLLVKRGITVTLVEAATDFYRVFRGEGLMPSGLDALAKMGLSEILEQVPHRQFDAWEIILGKKSLFRVEEPMETNTSGCTLVSQPPLLEALIAQSQTYPQFEFLQGVSVKDLLWIDNRIVGVKLSDRREIKASVVVGADGRNSIIRRSAGLHLDREPNDINILWFKLASSPQFESENVFYAVSNGDKSFGLFHGAEEGKLHLSWILFTKEEIDTSEESLGDRKPAQWASLFAQNAPSWMAEHFLKNADTITRPIKLSVVVGRCQKWYAPGLILLGDAAHPMSPIRAQGINVALRDVIVAANHLVPLLLTSSPNAAIDEALARIQAEREPEIIRAQQLQAEEATQAEILRKYAFIRPLMFQVARLFRNKIRQSWIERQHDMRVGVTQVQLNV
ncbi:putative monooxygenase, FAD-binding protein [Tolypothrix sp. NIES-4075]|uniref:FAD-dependent monooxygenase n=1 Tax=Tolypothrix sp. NIES-4075 TaxID=2005459 RepID=UPI000B5CFEC6|nr:putative monooxygenase, FAD-binding protein [Tolypothrix sp. NIES-4075]